MRGGSWRGIEFPALVGLIEHPQRGLMLYDTGYSSHFETATRSFPECLYRVVTPVSLPPEEELLQQLEARGIRPTDIETIFISHFHADHVAGLRDFPQARFIATQSERRVCENKGRIGRLRRAFLSELLPSDFDTRLTPVESLPVISLPTDWHPFTMACDLLGDSSILGLDLPGHTASQLGLGFRTTPDEMIFLVGDACWKIEALAQNRPPSRLAYQLFHNGKTYDETFVRLQSLHGSSQAPQIIPSHCSTTWKQRGGTRHITRV